MLKLEWIKAHTNYKGNERADELVRNAVFQSVVYFDVLPPMNFLKTQLKEMITDIWNKLWQKNRTCRMTKIFYPKIAYRKAKQLTFLNRQDSRLLIEIVTGQNNLNYIQNKVRGTDDLCRLCEENEETFDHLVNDCPCITTLRLNYFGHGKIQESHNWQIRKLLQFSKEPQIDGVLGGQNNLDKSAHK